VSKDFFLHSTVTSPVYSLVYNKQSAYTNTPILDIQITPKMSFHATYNPHLLAPPTQRHHSHHHHQNRLSQNAQASESTSSLNTGLRAKLKSALEFQKHAHFDVKINIHEISNVPQLQGEFCCQWHVRGKSPKVREGSTGEFISYALQSAFKF